jgi:hypothetical protein
LLEITDHERLEEWLRTQPRQVAVAIAARAALRALPIIQTEASTERDSFPSLVLSVFRATAISWTVARFPDFRTASAIPAILANTSTTVLARLAEASTFAVQAATAAVRATIVIDPPASAAVADTVDAAARAVYSGTGYSPYGMDFATKFGADPVTEAFWSAVSVDAIQAQQGETASFIADSPLWFHDQPERLKDLWKDMKSILLAAGQDWQVWTTWYDDRLDGRVREEERELAYVRIESEIWNQGPAIVNAEIERQIEGPWLIQETAEAQDSVTAEVIRGIEEIKPHGPLVGLSADMTSRAGGLMRPHGPAVVEQPQLVPPEPPLEPGPLLRVTERGLEIIPQPMGEDFDEDLQKALHGRLQRLLPTLAEG